MAWTWITEGMKNLAQEGFFETTYPGANVSFWITDYHAHVDTMIEWVELLNPPARSLRTRSGCAPTGDHCWAAQSTRQRGPLPPRIREIAAHWELTPSTRTNGTTGQRKPG